jgi:DNA-binding Xre family transcriptional regulator
MRNVAPAVALPKKRKPRVAKREAKKKTGKTNLATSVDLSKLKLHRLRRAADGGVAVNGLTTLPRVLDEIKSGKYKDVDKINIPGFLCNHFEPAYPGAPIKNRVRYLHRITGLWTFDFDVKDKAKAVAIREAVIKCPFIIASFLSVSGKSAKAVGWVKPTIYDLDLIRKFKNDRFEKRRIELIYYQALCNKVRPYLPEGTVFDLSVGALHQPVWLSVDPDLKSKSL